MEEVGNRKGSDLPVDSCIEGQDSNRPVGGTTHNSGANSVQDARQESGSRLIQVDQEINPLLRESPQSATETKRHIRTLNPLSPAFLSRLPAVFKYDTSANHNDQVSTGQHSSNLLDSLTNQLTQVQSELADTKRQLRQKQALPADLQIAHDLERSMQRRIDKLSAELEAANISGQKYESSAEELADLKQKLAGVESGKSALDARLQRDADALSPDLSERRVRSQYHKARAARYRQERETLQETQSLAQPAQEKLMRELHVMKSNEATLDARLKSLMQERAEAQATIKRLRNAKDAQGSSQGTFSLDSFRDAVDQVSEAHVSFTGHPSVERLNEAIDNMVLEVLEQACEALAAHGDSITHFDVKPPPLDTPLFASLAKPSLTEDNRGFLLDALLHNLIVPFVYDMFFQRTISTIAVDDEVEVLDKVFSKITAAEPWAVCQRWRAMTASATAVMFKPAALEKQADHIEEVFSQYIAWAYGQPLAIFQPIRAKLLQNITSVMHDAHQLSLVLRRDILSVRVMAALRHGRDSSYDPQSEDSIWPEMGAKAGDEVIGVYGLGLQKSTPTGHTVVVVKPKVITNALLREIEKKR